MTEDARAQSPDSIEMASNIVAAYVSNNRVAAAELPALIGTVHGILVRLADTGASVAASPSVTIEKPNAARIRASVTEAGIVSFIDGKSYKTLKRHLTAHGLTPQSYRERYGLPADYPMVAPAYAARRSALAKQIGLGVPGAQADRGMSARNAA